MRHIFLSRRHWFGLGVIALVIIFEALILATHQAQAGPPPPCRPYDPTKEDPPFCVGDHRVNPRDPIAPLTAYCQDDHSLTMTAIVNGEGHDLFNVPALSIANGLASAQASGHDLVVWDQFGRQLWALASGELLISDVTGYTFRFAGDFCGLVPATTNQLGSQNPPRAPRPTRIPRPTRMPRPTQIPRPTATPRPTRTPRPDNSGVDTSNLSGASVTTGNIRMRRIPNINSEIVAFIPTGSNIQVIGRTSALNWIKVTFEGVTGWITPVYSGLSVDALFALPILPLDQ